MNTAVAHAPLPSSRASAASIGTVVAFAAVAFVWLGFVRQLKLEWSFNPQYGYGWSVPFIALYLLWRRWISRPAPMPNEFRLPILIVCAAGALVFFPIRFVAEANPDWRLLDWATALITVGITMSIFFYRGGIPWLRHFAFPILFLLIAVPWPVQFEQFVIQNLMRVVTSINVALLNIIGVPALQHGNLIELGSGIIGIEEACSGVRSLQATLMISLFLGELYFFSVGRRVILLVAGVALALFCNLVRTFILVWLGAKRGADAIHAWHDPAGLTILLVCLFGLWLLSLFMRSNAAPFSSPSQQKSGDGAQLPISFSIALCLWFLFAEAATQFWYRSHESKLATAHWAVEWPRSESAYQNVAIAPEAAGLLRFDDGGGASWTAADARHWMMYFFSWLPGHTAALFVKVHRPDICLPASGLTLTNDHGLRLLDINNLALPIRSYRFDHNGTPLHVFYCYWDARSSFDNSKAEPEEDWSARGRIRSALQGHREIGAQMLELAVWGYDDDAEAEAALRQQLARILRRS